jgi:septum formation protein
MMTKYRNLHRLISKYKLVLASGSPRRVQLLKEAGIDFRQIIPHIDESDDKQLPPYEMALILSEKKARAVSDKIHHDEVVIGCDTIVVYGNKVLGKPASEKEAETMLTMLSGQKHTVCSAVSYYSRSGKLEGGYELADVYFKKVPAGKIREYVLTGEPLDKAGAYGIQDRGVFLVDRVVGNIDNVIGMPMTLVDELARRIMSVKGLYG